MAIKRNNWLLLSQIRLFSKGVAIAVFIAMTAFIAVIQSILYFGRDLPDYTQLAQYDPPTITRLYSSDSNVFTEYALERRIYVEFEDIPQLVINAFIAAEDKNFFKHPGVDIYSTIRAALQSIINLVLNRRAIGGSTITQQVIKDLLLSNERTVSRKIKEAILAYRVSKVYSKERILELYLNKIFLGNNSYGIAAAAQSYFGKDLNSLTVPEAAMLAALPKAPSSLNPFTHYEKAKARRNWVIERMAEEKMITNREASYFMQEPIKLYKKNITLSGENFYSDVVKQELIKLLGEEAVYKKGLVVHTNLDDNIQRVAEEALREGLVAYDKRHGWRGPLFHINSNVNTSWQQELLKVPVPTEIGQCQLAVVLKFNRDRSIKIGLANGQDGIIPFEKLQWARKSLKNNILGPAINIPQDILRIGDVIIVQKDISNGAYYSLEQIPEIDGGIVVMEPNSGRVFAIVGGYHFSRGYFNRAIQAKRQPGSLFKPFVYLAAMEEGFSPNSMVLDEPISISQGPNLPLWKPKNFGGNYLGEITFRTALERSRNLPTVRIVLALGIQKVIELAQRFGIYRSPSSNYAVALGAYETTLIAITNAFNSIASGGLATTPRLVESVFDRKGNLLYRDVDIRCYNCDIFEQDENSGVFYFLQPSIIYANHRIVTEDVNYQILSMLEGAVQRGTAAKAKTLNKTVAGKTGTTNDSLDAWFVGLTPYLTVGVYVGFDIPKNMGQKETGSTVALPIFVKFMQKAVAMMPDVKFSVPDTIEFKKIYQDTGEIVDENQLGNSVPASAIITEAFRKNDINDYTQSTIRDMERIPLYNLSEFIEGLELGTED